MSENKRHFSHANVEEIIPMDMYQKAKRVRRNAKCTAGMDTLSEPVMVDVFEKKGNSEEINKNYESLRYCGKSKDCKSVLE